MLFSLTAVVLLACADKSVARGIPSISALTQQLLSDLTINLPLPPVTISDSMADARKRVPGDSPAFYCNSTAPEDQLFKIEELTVAPNPPEAGKRYFIYLRGEAPDDPALKDVNLKLTGFKGDERMGEWEARLSDCPPLVVRKDWEYGKELKSGTVEILADQALYSHFIETGDYRFVAEASFPDGRVLFCFEADVHLKGDK